MGDRIAQRFSETAKDFELAAQRAQQALNSASDPSINYLVRALALYSKATGDALVAISEQLDDVNRNVNNVHARLQGKQGPFDLRMR